MSYGNRCMAGEVPQMNDDLLQVGHRCCWYSSTLARGYRAQGGGGTAGGSSSGGSVNTPLTGPGNDGPNPNPGPNPGPDPDHEPLTDEDICCSKRLRDITEAVLLRSDYTTDPAS